VQIPRAVRDDYDLIVKESVVEARDLEESMFRDLRRAQLLGGLHYFSFHTQFFGDPERVAVLVHLAEAIRERGGWLTTASDLADWWLRRGDCRVRFERVGPRRILIRVTNEGGREVENLTLRAYVNVPLSAISISGTIVFQTLPRLEFQEGASHVDLILPPLGARESAAYNLDFEPLPPRIARQTSGGGGRIRK
jgi:hypothetical protein